MNAFQKNWFTTTLPESSVILAGLLLALFGFVLSASIFVGFGIALLIAGTAYIATEGSGVVRFTLAFVSLVAAQLLPFRGVIRWIGGIAIGGVVIAIAYSRLRGAGDA